jgi:hypothetical protein
MHSTPYQKLQNVPKVNPVDFHVREHYLHVYHQKGRRPNNNEDDSDSDSDNDNDNDNDKKLQWNYETPVLIENVLSSTQCDAFCDALVTNLGHVEVDVQRKYYTDDDVHNDGHNDGHNNYGHDDNGTNLAHTQIHTCTLNEALGLMMESQYRDSLFCFSEGLMDTNVDVDESDVDVDGDGDGDGDSIMTVKEMKHFCQSKRESLFLNGGHNHSGGIVGKKNTSKKTDRSNNNCHKKMKKIGDEEKEEGEELNFFHYFPKNVQPSDCVIIAGEGATSTLHRDPFEWTGTSLCLEGTKIWRFLAPPGAVMGIKNKNEETNGGTYYEDDMEDVIDDNNHNESGVSHIDKLLNAYRLSSVAWDNEDDDNDENDNNDENTTYLSSGWQSDYSLYSSFVNHDKYPSAEEFATMDEDEKNYIIQELANNVDALQPNCSPQKITDGSPQNHGDDDPRDVVSIWTVVQKPGDLLVIPAYWWHQTFALEPSIAIASQRCDRERDLERVIKHILDTSGCMEGHNGDEYPTIATDEYLSTHSMEEIANELFHTLGSKK